MTPLVTRGVRLIGTDPDEWFEGEQVAEVLQQEVQDTTDIEEVSPRACYELD